MLHSLNGDSKYNPVIFQEGTNVLRKRTPLALESLEDGGGGGGARTLGNRGAGGVRGKGGTRKF